MGENTVIFIYDRGEHQYDGPDAAAPVNHLITAEFLKINYDFYSSGTH